MYGIREFAAVINPPHGCILAVGAGEQRPVVRDGAARGRDGDDLHAVLRSPRRRRRGRRAIPRRLQEARRRPADDAAVTAARRPSDHRRPRESGGAQVSAVPPRTPGLPAFARNDGEGGWRRILRPDRGRRRAGRLCRGDPGGAARHEDGAGRARASRRHLPELGLHSDQGAAAHLGDLPPAAPSRRIRLLGASDITYRCRERSWRARGPSRSSCRTASPICCARTRSRCSTAQARLAGKGKLAVAKDGKPVAELAADAYRAGDRRAGALAAGARARRQAASGPTRRRWCRRRSRNRCWSSARARSGSNSPASTATWAPR